MKALSLQYYGVLDDTNSESPRNVKTTQQLDVELLTTY